MKQSAQYVMLAGAIGCSFFAQQLPPTAAARPSFQAQSPSSVSLTGKGEEQTLRIHNVAYEVSSDSVPGRPRGERLLLRRTTSSSRVLGEIGQTAGTVLEAWPLGTGLNQKPLYTVKASGTGAHTVDSALVVVDRGLEQVDWWSVYRLGTGRHLFDTYVPLLGFSISRDTVESRYVGLEVPPDDTADARLKRDNVIAVLIYSSQERVKSEALLTADLPRQAQLLRSYADTTRTVSLLDGTPPAGVRIVFRSNDSSPKPAVTVTIPLAADDLDLARTQLPAHLHLAAWKR